MNPKEVLMLLLRVFLSSFFFLLRISSYFLMRRFKWALILVMRPRRSADLRSDFWRDRRRSTWREKVGEGSRWGDEAM